MMKKMMKKALAKALVWAKKTLRYARINDEKGLLSLTNLAMLIVMYKMATTSATSWQDLTALSVTILGYQAKRAIEKKK